MSETIKQKINAALRCINQGDPDLAIKAIDNALEFPLTQQQVKLLEKAKDECEVGTLQAAETYLGMAVNE